MALDSAFEVDQLLIGDLAGIVSGASDPSSLGFDAPQGTLYLRSNGETYAKTGASNTAWTLLSTASGTDKYVAATSNDTTPGYLDDKIVLSSAINRSIGNPSANETYILSLSTPLEQISALSPTDNNFIVYDTGGGTWTVETPATARTTLGAASQAEVDNIEGAIGAMIGGSGLYIAHTTSNYINGNTSVTQDLLDLDSQIFTNAGNISTNTTNISNAQTEIDYIEAAMGTVIDTDGNYVAFSGTNYLDGNTSVTEDLTDLDSQVYTNTTNITNAQSEIDNIETAMGTVIDANGDYVAHTGTNYIDGNSDVTTDLTDLDTGLGNAQTEIDNIENAIGASINSSGIYVPYTTTFYLNGNSEISEDITDLDSALHSHATNTNNPHLTSVVNLTDTTITSPVNRQVLVYNATSAKWENHSGADADGLDGSIDVTASYSADTEVFLKVDTTNNPVTITLPLTANYVNKFFHIKWVDGKQSNKVTITSQTGETIDDETSQILGQIKDSLQLFSDGTTWHII